MIRSLTANEREQFQQFEGKVRELAAALQRMNVDAPEAEAILAGGEAVDPRDAMAVRQWMQSAMERMEARLPQQRWQPLREMCACCTGGKRHTLARAIYQDHDSLEARVEALSRTPYIVGHSARLTEDGRVIVAFAGEGEEHGCPCLPVTEQAMPVSYCYCCAGHIKRHVQTALGRKLGVRAISTALSTAGKKGCVFELTPQEGTP